MATRLMFDKSARGWVLSIFDKTMDSEGFIIDSNNCRVTTPEGSEITEDELAIIKKGSEKFIAGDLTSLMKFTRNEL